MLRHLTETRGPEAVLPTARHAKEGWVTLDLAELETERDAAALFDAYELNSMYCVAGMTDVDGCEAAGELAHRTNARGPGVLAAYARARLVPFVYFSTEYVFAGAAEDPGPYPEDAPVRPLSVYGKSKVAGERAVREAYPEALVLRTTVVYGADARQKNYLYSVMRNLSGGTRMRVPVDQISTPTYNRDLIRAAIGLAEMRESGIFHVCGPELLGRMEFAVAIAESLGLDASLLQGVPTAALGQRAARPLAAGLATTKLATMHPQLRVRTVAEALEDCAAEMEEFLGRMPSLSHGANLT